MKKSISDAQVKRWTDAILSFCVKNPVVSPAEICNLLQQLGAPENRMNEINKSLINIIQGRNSKWRKQKK